MTVINSSSSSGANRLTIFASLSRRLRGYHLPARQRDLPQLGVDQLRRHHLCVCRRAHVGIRPQVLNKIRAVNPAVVLNAVAGTVVPVVTARSGTFIGAYAVNGNATIYVVGTDGELHGFSTPKQYKAAGYDTALNTTSTPSGGMTIGSAIGVWVRRTALATSSDGAMVDSSGTYYTFGGGRALGIPTPARLNLITKYNTATILTGTVSTTQKTGQPG